MATVAPSTDLKRLAFVETAAANSVEFVTGTKVFSKACGYYSSAKETNALKGSLTKIEDLIKAYGTPVVSKVQEKYPTYMTTVDAKVDTAVTLLQTIWANKIAPSAPVAYAKSALALTPEKLEELKVTREAYFSKIEQTLALLRAKAVALPEKLTGAVTAAIAEARVQVDNAQLFEKVKSAYETVLKYPAVAAVLERAAPAAAKAADVAAPYVAKAAAFAEPYVAAVKTKVMPSKPIEQLD